MSLWIILPELMALVREHIEGERARVVARAKRRNERYVDPGALFLSCTTGRVLTKDYISARLSKLIRAADVQNASGHRLRASGLTALVAAYDGYDETGKPLPAETGVVESRRTCRPQALADARALSEDCPQRGVEAPGRAQAARPHPGRILERRVVRSRAELRARRAGVRTGERGRCGCGGLGARSGWRLHARHQGVHLRDAGGLVRPRRA